MLEGIIDEKENNVNEESKNVQNMILQDYEKHYSTLLRLCDQVVLLDEFKNNPSDIKSFMPHVPKSRYFTAMHKLYKLTNASVKIVYEELCNVVRSMVYIYSNQPSPIKMFINKCDGVPCYLIPADGNYDETKDEQYRFIIVPMSQNVKFAAFFVKCSPKFLIEQQEELEKSKKEEK